MSRPPATCFPPNPLPTLGLGPVQPHGIWNCKTSSNLLSTPGTNSTWDLILSPQFPSLLPNPIPPRHSHKATHSFSPDRQVILKMSPSHSHRDIQSVSPEHQVILTRQPSHSPKATKSFSPNHPVILSKPPSHSHQATKSSSQVNPVILTTLPSHSHRVTQ